jgi:hypothetical protein
VTLLTFPSDGAQYTLPRVPATDDGVTYTRVAGVQFETGVSGVGDSTAVRIGFTQEANIVIVGAQPAASFDVSNLDPQDVTVTQGDNITITATVENTGDLTDTQTVEFRVNGSEVANQSVELAGGASTTVTFENVSTAGLASGDYTHGVFTEDSNQTATLTVEADSGNGNDDGNGNGSFQDVLVTIEDFNNGEASFGEVLEAIAEFNAEN